MDDEVVLRLKARARSNERSLEGELREIISTAARTPTPRQLRVIADEFKASIPRDRGHSNSTNLIRADRDRDT